MKRRVYHDELLKTGILPWKSMRTTKRKIKEDNFPAYYDGKKYSFDISEVEAWFKQRHTLSA